MRGTEDTHVLLQTVIIHASALKQRLVVVYFDLRKACDTTWRHRILQAVHRCDIRGKVALCIQHFFKINIYLKLRLHPVPLLFENKNR